MIGFVGSVFSPYYAWARRRSGTADPERHCAINVAIYGPGRSRWAMTERGGRDLQRDAGRLQVGPSNLHWDGDALVVEIDEWTAPWPSRLRGTVRVEPSALGEQVFALDAAGRHEWQPVAPAARVEVSLDAPALRWRGSAYLDRNAGERPLERDFVRWDWSRAPLADGSAAVLYEVERREAPPLSLALRVDATGRAEAFEPPPRAPLRPTAWRMPRVTRSEDPASARALRSFEDAPFYSRSLVESTLFGQRVQAVHESLSLDRFATPWCQAMLPFRMPRAFARRG